MYRHPNIHYLCISQVLSSHLSIRKEKHHVFALHTSHPVKFPQVLMEAVVVVTSTQFDLKAAVPTHMGCQPSERLLACTSHPD